MSYGHTWTAQRDTNLALLPVGYADGIFRSLGGRLQVSINGRRRPLIDTCSRPPRIGPICSAPSTTKW
ncbi:hypothetical protein MAHJHV28_45490 [Mycobacterium avium subsp. hominissuis]